MRLLIIAGTRFLGRHLVGAALARGDSATPFNCGQSSPQPPGVAWLRGDRAGDLSALADGPGWDAAIDTCGDLPADTGPLAQAQAQALAGRARFVALARERRQGLGDGSATNPLQVMRKLLRLVNLRVEVVALATPCVNQTRSPGSFSWSLPGHRHQQSVVSDRLASPSGNVESPGVRGLLLPSNRP